MKIILSFFILTIIGLNCFGQELEGEWKGSFTYYFKDSRFPSENFQSRTYPIRINIVLNPDSTFTGISYSEGSDSKGHDTIHVCAVICRRISADSVYLQEVKLIKPDNVVDECMQKMYLQFEKRKRSIALKGQWETNVNKCGNLSGEMTLYKKIPD